MDVQVREENQTFPQITICNKNPYQKEQNSTPSNSFLRSNNDFRLYKDLIYKIRNLQEYEKTTLSYKASAFVFIAYFVGG